ncbi:MAG: secondary thiamine-phosphate synthase enzyme YjbQ [Fidelibacterota bacterium]
METFQVRTSGRVDFVDITPSINKLINDKKWKDGLLTVFVPHTTAGITINENADPSVISDMKKMLEEIVPMHHGFTHLEGNSDAHIKTSLLGSSEQLIVENGIIQLGTWQGIFLSDFDGPRQRKVWVKFIPA